MPDLDTFLALSIALYVTVAVAVLLYALLVRKAGVLDPIVQFLAFLSVFVLPLPVRALITKVVEGDVTEHLPLILPYIPVAVTLTALGLPLFAWTYYSSAAKVLGRRLPCPPSSAGRREYFAFAVLATVSVLLLLELARTSGGLLGFLLLGYGSIAEMFGRGYLAVGIPWFFVGSLFLLYRYARRRSRLDLVLFSIALILQVAVQFLLGDRHSILYMFMVVLFFVHHAVRPIRFKTLAITVLCLYLALNVTGVLRGANYSSLPDFWSRTATALSSTSDSHTSLYYTLTTGEFVVPFESFPQMIRTVGTTINAQFGSTYVKAFTFFVPSVLFPGRPLPLTNWYMRTFYGTGWGLYEGRAFFFLSEGYLNFGPAGVFLTMAAWGLFLGAARSYMDTVQSEPGAIMLYALTIAWIFRGIAGDFVSTLVGLPEQSLFAAIVGLLLATRFRPWRFGTAAKVTA